MARDPAATARAAFAMASRPELSDGQRAAALNRGMAIVEKYGLDPDRFDIPGREPATRSMNGKRPTIAVFDEFHEFDEGFFAAIIREERARVMRTLNEELAEFQRRAAAEELFQRTQRNQQMKARFDATILGRDRIRIVRNDGC